MPEEWPPRAGMLVCTCRLEHEEIIHVDPDGDTIITRNSAGKEYACSFSHCCDPIDHEWKHEDIINPDR